jgi:hypothetical protein
MPGTGAIRSIAEMRWLTPFCDRVKIPIDIFLEIWESGLVKTTLEIDDDLYREAKAHASLTGRKMKDLVTEGLRLALRSATRTPGPASAAASRRLTACFAEADKLMQAASPGPAAREHLNEGRNRLDRHERGHR